MGSQVPGILDALKTLTSSAVPSGVIVLDGGETTTERRANFLIVGANNADPEGEVAAGESQSRHHLMGQPARLEESGFVNMLAGAYTGNNVQKEARDAAVAIVDAVTGVCTSNPSLGLPTVMWTVPGPISRWWQFRSDTGDLWALVEFQIAFKAHN